MIKQSDIFLGEDLSAIEKYNLEKEKSNEFLNYMKDCGMKVIEDVKTNRKIQKIELQENFYFRDKESIYKIKYCMRRLIFCFDLMTKQNRAIQEKNVLTCSESLGLLLKKNDVLYMKLENGVVRKFVFMSAFKWKNNDFRIQAYDLEDGEVFVFSEKQIYKIISLGKDD